ncbi:hypothetical protein JCGZ_17572 [Jatropha curcas]|uniref:Protein kinase domain-containing protein n=2 Tax=Jatropha curcas TaxID=180498 RepID=A0A067K3M6_JATCU|nr:hypothetical protein JCGZ_17572 [Jatropha curcas]
MIEEYHGLEKLGGSQRLRIFLIPLCECEKSSPFEATTIQQNSPSYQFVVAVNGILDTTPKKNSGGDCSTSEASQPESILDCNSGFRKHSPSPFSPLEMKNGLSAFFPPKFSNESPRSPHQSPPISPIPLQHQDSANSHKKLHCNNSSVENSNSCASAQFPPDNCSMNQPSQGLGAFMNHCHPYVDVVQSHQQHGVQSHNHNLDKQLATPWAFNLREGSFDDLYFERLMHKERAFHSEKPFLGMEDPTGLSASMNSIDSHYGMPHAFSDSKLQEHGGLSAYCSQEGMSPSSPLNFAKTQLSSLVSSSSQEKLVQLHENNNVVNPTLQNKLSDIESTKSCSRLDLLNFSSCSESTGRDKPIQKATVDADDQCQITSHCEEYLLSSEMMNAFDRSNPGFHQSEKPFVEKLRAAGTEYESKFEDRLTASPGINSKSSVNDFMEHSHNYQAPSNLLLMDQGNDYNQYCSLKGELNSEQGSHITKTGRLDVEELFSICQLQPHSEISSVDLVSGALNHQFFHESSRVQPIESQNMDNKDSLLLSPKIPSSFCEDSCPNTNANDLHCKTNNVTKDALFERKVSHLVENYGSYLDQKVEQLGFGGPAYDKSNIGDLMLAQIKSLSKNQYQNLWEPLVTGEAATPLTAQSSDAVPHVANLVSDDFRSTTITEAESIMPHVAVYVTDPTTSDFVAPSSRGSDSIIPHVQPPVANPTNSDFISPIATVDESIMQETEFEDINDDDGNKDTSISDAVMAEMEASIYGLQIIKNADLEELIELGSGTYGTVYHGKWRGTDVAIKRIKKSCFSGRSSEQERLTKDFWREAQILSNLHHPNVVAFYGVVPDGAGGTLATVTEYMVNGSLRHVLLKKDRSLDHRKKLIIAMDAAFGMEYLHSKNIVHFDLKCDNLLVNLRDPLRPICKVGDFGLSRIKHNTLVSGGVRGTLPWMAPELLNGSSSRVSEKIDVFSFGISLWEILTGEEPYADMHCGAIIGGIVKNVLRPPIPESCDPEWRKLMEQCWSPDPDSRPSFTEITNRLRAMSMVLQAKGQNIQTRPMKPKVPTNQ